MACIIFAAFCSKLILVLYCENNVIFGIFVVDTICNFIIYCLFSEVYDNLNRT